MKKKKKTSRLHLFYQRDSNMDIYKLISQADTLKKIDIDAQQRNES